MVPPWPQKKIVPEYYKEWYYSSHSNRLCYLNPNPGDVSSVCLVFKLFHTAESKGEGAPVSPQSFCPYKPCRFCSCRKHSASFTLSLYSPSCLSGRVPLSIPMRLAKPCWAVPARPVWSARLDPATSPSSPRYVYFLVLPWSSPYNFNLCLFSQSATVSIVVFQLVHRMKLEWYMWDREV